MGLVTHRGSLSCLGEARQGAVRNGNEGFKVLCRETAENQGNVKIWRPTASRSETRSENTLRTEGGTLETSIELFISCIGTLNNLICQHQRVSRQEWT